ncbi:MAG: hypothetical protein KME46_32725 [Brasilonema angustatum HA4187-MV1]|jgi:hypothetical protein|nr:hypothetical protein [Brasilonema angustatum HA4187-MV1]
MSFFNNINIKRLITSSSSVPFPRKQQAKEIEAPFIHKWDSSTQLMDLTGHGDWLTLGDCFTGIAVFGAAGSGKTSSLATVAQCLMLLDCGFVWLCAKPDEVRLARKIAASAGREKDVIVIGEDVNGVITRHRFNPLQYEASRPGQGTTSVTTYLSDCAKVLSRKEGERSGGEGERFWNDQFERLLRHCIDTAKYAGRSLSVALLREIQLSAPTQPEDISSEAWVANSTCWQCICEAEAQMEQGNLPKVDFSRILNFWTKDYATLDVKPRSSIDVMFAVLADAFTAEEPVRYILSGESSVTPDDVIEHGKIVILSLPTNIYHNAGRMAQFTFKFSYQRRVLARKFSDASSLRPTVLWVDEAHAFAHPFDSQYFREVRSNRGINVYLEQGIGGYMQAMNFHSPDQVDDYLQNLSTKYFFYNSSPETNLFASNAIGKMLTEKGTDSFSYSNANNVSTSNSTTQEERHQIVSGEFGFLKRGGTKNNCIVTGYVLRPEIFNSTGTNVSLCSFRQTTLTH